MKVSVTLADGFPTPQGIARTTGTYEKVKDVAYTDGFVVLTMDDGGAVRYNLTHVLSVTVDPFGSIARV